MKRPALLIAVLLVASLVALTTATIAWSGRQPRAYTPQGQGDLYVALGDSLAWGFRLDDPQSDSYPGQLHQALVTREPLELSNLAVPGETSDSLLDRQLPRAIQVIRDARRRGLEVSPITVGIGGNDLRAVERAGPDERAAAIAEARTNLRRILDNLRDAAGPRADIAVMTYYNPYGGDPSVENSEAYWVEQLNAVIREESANRGVAVAEVYAAFAGGREYTHTFILFGDVHANAQGHQLIANAFLQALRYR